jgi:methionine-rich copper-binding protein CopC
VTPARAFMIALVLALAPGAPAGAHAFLDRAEPRVGSTAATPPTQIRLWFTQALEPTLCVVKVVGPAGAGGAGPVQPVSADPRGLVVGLRRPIPAGRYLVHWRVVSVDSHVTEGDFSFQVRP